MTRIRRLFRIEDTLCVAVALLALLLPGRTRHLWLFLAAALLAVNEWLLRPAMRAAHARGAAWGLTFGVWHGVAAIVYLCACLAALLLVWNDDFR